MNRHHKMADVLRITIAVIYILFWLLILKFLPTEVAAFILSLLFLFGFKYRNTCKRVFEATIFFFVLHFDVGDMYVIDGVEVTVLEMNFFTTVFLGCDDNQKIIIPNSFALFAQLF